MSHFIVWQQQPGVALDIPLALL